MYPKHADSTTGGGGAIARSINAPRSNLAGATGISRSDKNAFNFGYPNNQDAQNTLAKISTEIYPIFDDSGTETNDPHYFATNNRGYNNNVDFRSTSRNIKETEVKLKSLESEIKKNPTGSYKDKIDSLKKEIVQRMNRSNDYQADHRYDKDYYYNGKQPDQDQTGGSIRGALISKINSSSGEERNKYVSAKRAVEGYIKNTEVAVNRQISSVEKLGERYNALVRATGTGNQLRSTTGTLRVTSDKNESARVLDHKGNGIKFTKFEEVK